MCFLQNKRLNLCLLSVLCNQAKSHQRKCCWAEYRHQCDVIVGLNESDKTKGFMICLFFICLRQHTSFRDWTGLTVIRKLVLLSLLKSNPQSKKCWLCKDAVAFIEMELMLLENQYSFLCRTLLNVAHIIPVCTIISFQNYPNLKSVFFFFFIDHQNIAAIGSAKGF